MRERGESVSNPVGEQEGTHRRTVVAERRHPVRGRQGCSVKNGWERKRLKQKKIDRKGRGGTRNTNA